MEIKNMLKELKTRLTQIEQRLSAIDEEATHLLEEQKHVAALVEHYDKLQYDPIEEERRVTTQLLHLSETTTQSKRTILPPRNPKPKTYGTSKYNDLINLMFDDGKTHNFIEIRDTMSKLAEHKFSDGNISTLLKYAIKHNMIKKESRGQYRKQE